ncbi:hypothetical protein HID58_079417 [Brassica napus]|uniref:Secreted protein n=1 Tax=Brassica napus TaxID=3708 RepID=A0ABQ7Y1Y9_BRANA|nr:hypothetical protein HID58_079413 [Brassica napus]KAH0862206.1 hypothetical protein HID58_079417 [Brassica napus]
MIDVLRAPLPSLFFYTDLLLCSISSSMGSLNLVRQPLFHGVPRGLRADLNLSSCLRWTVKGSRRRIRDYIAIVEP